LETEEKYNSRFLFCGLLIYTAIYYSQIAGRYPVLAPFRVEFIVGSILLVVIGIKVVERELLYSENKVSHAAFIFFVYCGLTIPFSYVISRALEQYIQFFKFFTIYLMIISCINSEKRLNIFFYVYLSMIALLFVEPFFLSLQGKGFRYANYMMRLYGVTGFFEHPNQLGGITAANLPFFYYMVYYQKTYIMKTVFISLIIIGVWVVMLTQSRTAFIGVIVFVFFAWLMSKHKALLIVLIIASFLIMYPFIPDQTKSRFLTLGKTSEIIGAEESEFAGDHEIGSMNSRWILLKRSLKIFGENPVMGVGMDCYPSVSGRRWNSWILTHNLYTQALAELGLIGMAIFAYLLYRIFINIKESELIMLSNNDRSIVFYVNAALYMFLMIRLVIGLFGHDLYRNWWWVAAGLSVVSLRVLRLKYPNSAKVIF